MKSNQKGKDVKKKQQQPTTNLFFFVDGFCHLCFRLLLLLRLPPFFFDFSQLRPGGGLFPPIARPLIGSAWARSGERGAEGEGEEERAPPPHTASEEENKRAAAGRRECSPQDKGRKARTEERCITEKASLPFCSVHPINNDNN